MQLLLLPPKRIPSDVEGLPGKFSGRISAFFSHDPIVKLSLI